MLEPEGFSRRPVALKYYKEEETAKDLEEKEEEKNEYEMEQDVFTFVFVYGPSYLFFYSLGVIAMQMLIIGLFYWDLLRDPDGVNKMNVPLRVDLQVRMAQFLALPLSIMFHGDCTTALYQLSAKYDPGVLKDFPNATRTSWTGTLFLRFFVGFSLIFISFIQIVQSDRITDLFLNLEAIVFVGNIDNFGFWLAEKNFLKREFRDACKDVKNITFPASKGSKHTIIRRIAALFVYMVLVIGWTTIVVKQKRGDYLKDAACNSFSVFFGDYTLDLETDRIKDNAQGTVRDTSQLFDRDESEVELVYSSFSGTYRIGEDNGKVRFLEDRAVYYEVVPGKSRTTQDKSMGKFFYCQGAWLFTVEILELAFNRTDDEKERVCGQWLLQSPETEAFTLEEVSTDGWKIWTGELEEAEDFSFSCDDCTLTATFMEHATTTTKNANATGTDWVIRVN
jgi:hypothetical protein